MAVSRAFAVAGALTGLLLTACGGGEKGGGSVAAGPPQPGGTAVIAVSTDFQGFNPVSTTHLTSIDVDKQMLFTPLIRYDSALNVQPYLAKSWELNDTSVTFHLRDDVRWHDGQPVTAEDVKFTFDLAKDSATASLLGSAYLNMVKSATVVDPHTVRFGFVAPHSQALDAFWWSPLPKHLLKDVPPAELAQAPFNRKPVGSGPYRFAEWRPNQSITFEANPDFPAELGGRPNLDRVVFRIIPEATTMVTELVSGSADVIGWTLQPDQAAQLQGQRGIEVHHFPSREFNYLAWNNRRPLFGDAAVRRALAMGINRPQIIQGLLRGYATPAHGMIPPWSPMYTELAPLPYNPQQAKQLLQQAGWRDTNGDGIVEKNGRPFRFTLLVNTANRLHQDIAQVVQEQLRQIGVDVQIQTAEFQSMLQRYRDRDYDAVLANWSLDTFKVDPTPLFSCAEAKIPRSANRTGYCNPEADRLITEGLRATDDSRAKATWASFSKVLQQDQPITFLYWADDLGGVGPRLQNVKMDVRSKLADVPEWWIPTNMRR